MELVLVCIYITPISFTWCFAQNKSSGPCTLGLIIWRSMQQRKVEMEREEKTCGYFSFPSLSWATRDQGGLRHCSKGFSQRSVLYLANPWCHPALDLMQFRKALSTILWKHLLDRAGCTYCFQPKGAKLHPVLSDSQTLLCSQSVFSKLISMQSACIPHETKLWSINKLKLHWQ